MCNNVTIGLWTAIEVVFLSTFFILYVHVLIGANRGTREKSEEKDVGGMSKGGR